MEATYFFEAAIYCRDKILLVQKEMENSHFGVGTELGTVTKHEFTGIREENKILNSNT